MFRLFRREPQSQVCTPLVRRCFTHTVAVAAAVAVAVATFVVVVVVDVVVLARSSSTFNPDPKARSPPTRTEPNPPTSETKAPKWEFPEIGGSLFWGPYNKDPTI